jgi:predicted phage tail protein
MPMPGKLVLVRDPGSFPRLRPAIAVAIDGASGQVVLDQPLQLPEGASQMVPRDCVFEFDPQVMEAVNSLVVAAQDKLNAAGQIVMLELELAEVDASDEDGDLILH